MFSLGCTNIETSNRFIKMQKCQKLLPSIRSIGPLYGKTSENRTRIQSTLNISKLMGLFFTCSITRSANLFALRIIWYKFKIPEMFKLPEVQNLHFGYFGLVKKFPVPNYGLRKQLKCIFDS